MATTCSASRPTKNFLRIPGAPAYWEEMDTRIAEALTGQSTPQEALDEVADGWLDITDDLDPDEQLALYRAAIGYEEE